MKTEQPPSVLGTESPHSTGKLGRVCENLVHFMQTCLADRNQWKNQHETRIPLLEISNPVVHFGITHPQPGQARHICEHVRTRCCPCFCLIFLPPQLNSSPTRVSQKVPLATGESSSSLQHAGWLLHILGIAMYFSIWR